MLAKHAIALKHRHQPRTTDINLLVSSSLRTFFRHTVSRVREIALLNVFPRLSVREIPQTNKLLLPVSLSPFAPFFFTLLRSIILLDQFIQGAIYTSTNRVIITGDNISVRVYFSELGIDRHDALISGCPESVFLSRACFLQQCETLKFFFYLEVVYGRFSLRTII